MKIDVLDQTGKKVDEVGLNPAIFAVPVNTALMAQAVRVRLMNARSGTAHTKTRDEVRGGGRKPWRQKGTGRARHGSIRSPLWKGGGVVHGPRAHKPEVSMPQVMRRAALFSALTDKVQANKLLVVDAIRLEQPKTQQMAAVLSALPIDKKVLFVLPTVDEQLQRASRNLANVKMMPARVLHTYEVLHYPTVVFLKDSLAALEETFLKKAEKPTKPKGTTKSAKASKQQQPAAEADPGQPTEAAADQPVAKTTSGRKTAVAKAADRPGKTAKPRTTKQAGGGK